MHQTVNSYVCLEWQSYETVGLIVSRVEGVASLLTLATLPHSPLVLVSASFLMMAGLGRLAAHPLTSRLYKMYLPTSKT